MLILVASIRDGRRGEPVARWFGELAGRREDLTSELVDLKQWDLPLLTSAKPPSRGEYEGIQQRWADKVAEGDGYVVVTPEYNHGYPAALKNALDLVYAEWNRKPVSFVSYGGAAGGLRAVEQLRQVAVELQMAPVRSHVAIPRVFRAIDDDGRLEGEPYEEAASTLLDQLVWWARALSAARA